MPTLTSLAPTNATPGSLLTLTGTGFLAGAIALFNSDAQAGQAVGAVISATEVRCIVPELPAGNYQVSVVNPVGVPSNGVPMAIGGGALKALCTLEDLKALMQIGVDDLANDRTLAICIRMASAEIVRFCRSTFDVASFTESLDGDGTNLLSLPHTPIIALQSLAIDGVAVDVAEARVYSLWIKFDDSDEYNARLRSNGRIFPRGLKNVTVTYTAGYSEIPDDLAMACARQAVYVYNTLAKQGVLNENNTSSQASKSFSLDSQLAPAVKSVALRYRRQTVAIV
jgi:hypothetical protein